MPGLFGLFIMTLQVVECMKTKCGKHQSGSAADCLIFTENNSENKFKNIGR